MKKELKNICPAIFPMPVILIATYNEDGTVDVMNAAWGCAHDTKEIKLNISEGHRTTKNIRRTGCFTVTVATEKHMAEADYVGIVSADRVKDKFERTGLKAHRSKIVDAPILDDFKFERTGLKAHRSKIVDAPILDDFPICMECKAKDCTDEYGVLGDILRLSVDEEYIGENGVIDLEKMRVIAYDPFNHGYYVVGKKVGQAFSIGKELMK